jgi:hypothetical protein
MAFAQGIRKNGNYVGGEALQPVSTATTVRSRNGKTLTKDGPFAETKEQLGGGSRGAGAGEMRFERPRPRTRTNLPFFRL